MVYLDLQEQLQNTLADIRLPHDGPEHEVVGTIGAIESKIAYAILDSH